MPKAIVNITIAIPPSIYLQALGFSINGDSSLAPYPKLKKNMNEARAAPIPKISRSGPSYREEALPNKTKVSR